MRPFILHIAAFVLTLAGPTTAHAEPKMPDVGALVTPVLISEIQGWLKNEIVTVSIEAQNKRFSTLTQPDIDALDKQWMRERDSADKPLIAATLSSPLSVYLNRIQGRALGLYVEVFVMDHNGLNVGQSSITSDFWQGDEAKFQKTFSVGKDTIFIDEPEWDDVAKIWRVQVNFSIAKEDADKPIGGATVELNLTELERRASS